MEMGHGSYESLSENKPADSCGSVNGKAHADAVTILSAVRRVFSVPVATISFQDGRKSWSDAAGDCDIPADIAERACRQILTEAGQRSFVSDATCDPYLRNLQIVSHWPFVRFCATVPVLDDEGNLATLDLLDTRPHSFGAHDLEELLRYGHLLASILQQGSFLAQIGQLTRETGDHALVIREQAEALAHSRKIFDRASNVAKIGVWECLLDDQNLRWTDGVYDIFGVPRGTPITREEILKLYTPESAAELEVVRSKAIAERGAFTLDARIHTPAGDPRCIRLTASVECDGDIPVRIFGMKQDITEEKLLADRNRFLAEFDVLTGLANRSRFQSDLAKFESPDDPTTSFNALLLVDLDGFKQVNDSFGHGLGDECLKEIAVRLRALSAQARLVARIGGDEFAIILGGDCDLAVANALAGRIVEALRHPIHFRDQSFQLGASIGIVMMDGTHGASSSDVFTNADTALYAAKTAGKNTYRVFDEAMNHLSNRRLRMIRDLGDALMDDRLEIHYQPKISLVDESIAGFEALLRCRGLDGETIPAMDFAAAFDDPELARRLGMWVIETALSQARLWTDAQLPFGHISINFSSSQLVNESLIRSLVARRRSLGLAAAAIEIEVNESAFRHDRVGEILSSLRLVAAEGMKISLDGFGAGAGSLALLRGYPIDTIKVDRSIVQNCTEGNVEAAMFEAIIRLGAKLDMQVLAEGVETRDQLTRLMAFGCPFAQGFFFSKAMTAPAVAALLKSIAVTTRALQATG